MARIPKLLPDIFSTSHGRGEVHSKDLPGVIELKGIRKKPSLFRAIVQEGVDIVRDLISEKQREVRKKYGLDISRADAATIIAFKNIMRMHEEDEGDLTQNIVVQNLNELEKNEVGEFALSFMDIHKHWHKANVEGSNSISVCQPDINIRYENEGEYLYAYIKSDLDTFAAVYRSINFPRGSRIYIFHKGVIAS